MIKKKSILEKSVERHKFCDICGTEIHIGMARSKAQCEYCGKDLCNKCIGHEDNTIGDYRNVWCKRCWDIGNEYRPIIDELETKIEELYSRWQELCK